MRKKKEHEIEKQRIIQEENAILAQVIPFAKRCRKSVLLKHEPKQENDRCFLLAAIIVSLEQVSQGILLIAFMRERQQKPQSNTHKSQALSKMPSLKETLSQYLRKKKALQIVRLSFFKLKATTILKRNFILETDHNLIETKD